MRFCLGTVEQHPWVYSELKHDIERRFSPFLEEDGKLPGCRVSVYPADNCFSDAKRLGQINTYTFLSAPGDVLLTDGENYAEVCEQYHHIKVYVSKNCSPVACATVLLHAYQYVLLMAGGLLLHGAGIVYDGNGIAFCGVPGAGKSTHSRLWQRYLSAKPLNNDQPGLVFYNGELFLTGSPWSGKEPCYKNESAPLKALVFVEQAQENCAKLLSPAETYSRLYLNNYLFPVTPELEKKYSERIGQITGAVPAVLLRCTISEAAVQTAFKSVFPQKRYKEVRCVKYKVSENFELKKVAGDWLLLPRGAFSINYSAVIVFNDTGVFLWNAMQQFVSEQELTDALAAQYAIEPAVVAPDVAAFLAKMKENNMLVES